MKKSELRKIIREEIKEALSGRIIKVKCDTTIDCKDVKDAVEKDPLNAKATIKSLIVTIDTTDNDPKDILGIIDRLPFSTKIV